MIWNYLNLLLNLKISYYTIRFHSGIRRQLVIINYKVDNYYLWTYDHWLGKYQTRQWLYSLRRLINLLHRLYIPQAPQCWYWFESTSCRYEYPCRLRRELAPGSRRLWGYLPHISMDGGGVELSGWGWGGGEKRFSR